MESIIQKAPVLAEIARFISGSVEINSATLQQAKRVVADTMSVAFSGVQTLAFTIALESRKLMFGNGVHPIWGTVEKSTLLGATFYNALSISSTDFDEGHRNAVGHPASLAVPTAMMLGRHLKKPLDEILKSIVVGYEIGTRFSHARFREKITTYSTGRWGAIASAATAAYLLELSVVKTMHALSLASILSPTMIGGSTDVSTGSMSKEGVAWAAQSGLQSALLAQNGFVGPYLFVDEHDDFRNTILLSDLGNNWQINTNYFKPFSCCRWLHPGIEAVLELKKEKSIDPIDVEKIEVNVFGRAIDLISSKYPENDVQAQFHLPYVIAVALLFDKVTPKLFTEFYLKNKQVRKLISNTSMIVNKEYTKKFPEFLTTSISIILKSGDVLSKEIPKAPWDAGDHPSDEQLYKKMVVQGGDEAIAIWNALFDKQ